MFVERTLLWKKQSYGLEWLRSIKKKPLFYPSILIVLLSIIALAVNGFVYHYPWNVYRVTGGAHLFLALFFMYTGFFLLYGQRGKMTRIAKEWIYFFLMLMLLLLASNATQYTPFPVIDQHILAFESLFNIDMNAIITWTHAHPSFKSGLGLVYDSLPYQMCYIPLIVIAAGRTDLIREHYFLSIITVLIGFTFYYFFPTTAPASVISSPYFSESQHATGLKFFQLHHYIQPSTQEGGLIALPSFHVIWAWLCLYLVRGWPIAFLSLLPVNVFIITSCVLLGWHYCTDIVASVVVILFSHALYAVTQKKYRDEWLAIHDL